jgi:hypothetical protein
VSGHPRFLGIFADLDKLKVPKGTPPVLYAEGVNVAYNCNNLVRNMTGEWLWIMGDDHRFKDDILLALLDHQVDIVVPVVPRRGLPFQTVLYQTASLDGESYMTYSWADLSRRYPEGGLAVVEGAGTAGMLIRKHVLTAIAEPWFEWGKRISEDIGFCLKARQQGYNIYADLDQRMTHSTLCELEPYRDQHGNWDVCVDVAGRRVSLLNTPHKGNDLREVTYARKPGVEGMEWLTPAREVAFGSSTE